MADHASLAEVEISLLRPLTPEETVLAERLLRLAQATLRSRVADLESKMFNDADYALRVSAVETSAVVRVIRNPEGMIQEAIGPFSGSRGSDEAPGELVFSKREWASLGVGTGAFTIVPHLQMPTSADLPPDMWVERYA